MHVFTESLIHRKSGVNPIIYRHLVREPESTVRAHQNPEPDRALSLWSDISC